MTLAKSFEKDIFISYCHTDNEDPMGDGWVELFHKILELRLVQILGARKDEEKPTIWRDIQLQGNDEFADVLSDELRKVAIVVSVLSPSYIRANWCLREVEEFCNAAAESVGLTVGAKGRIIKVLKDPVPREEHPPALQGQTGYPFFTIDKDTRRPVQFTLTPGDPTVSQAKKVIDDLARSILETLAAVNQAADATATPSDSASPSATIVPAAGGAVYLAETHYELDEQRQEIRRELEERNVTVLPAGDLPVRNPEEFKQAVREALAHCDVSVHLVAPQRSLVLPSEVEDTVYLQNQIAAERSAGHGLRRLIWMSPDFEVAAGDARQNDFVEQLARNREAQQGAEVLSVPRQGLIARIHETLKKQREAKSRQPEPLSSGEAPAIVYLIADPVDSEVVEPLSRHLYAQGFNVCERLSDPDATEEDLAAAHKMNLIDCSAAIVCVGNVRELWMRSMLSDLQKAVGWREGKPLQVRGIYLAPPSKPFKLQLRLHDYLLLDAGDGFSPAVLQPFVDLLAQSAGGERG